MKPRSKSRIYKIEQEVEDLVTEIMNALLPPEERTPERLDEIRDVWKQLPHTEQRRKFFESLSPEELEEKRQQLPSFPIVARKVLKQTIKNLPHGRGGRPKILTVELRRTVCKYVGTLMGNGCDLPNAQKRAAAKHGLSVRSVQRAWAERKTKEASII